MFKKISISLFLIMYVSVSTVSFAEEVVLQIISEIPLVIETVPAPVVENIPEVTIPETPPVAEVVPPVVLGDIPAPVGDDASVSQEKVLAPEEIATDIPVAPPVDVPGTLEAAPAEITEEAAVDEVPITDEPSTVMVEEDSTFTPPGPEPEPWEPTVVDNALGIPEGRGETQSDPAFLAENSVITRRMVADVVVDPAAKHSCKVDVFRTDISDTTVSTLSVNFYGTSMLAAYEAEIGSLPDGIDVRFKNNNEYRYDFHGKETSLELTVNKQDVSLAGDFTIPIIYTYKDTTDSTVICQLNIINEEEVPLAPVIVPPVEVIIPAQEFTEVTVVEKTGEPITIPVVDIQPPMTAEEILNILVPETSPVSPPVESPPSIIPETTAGLTEVKPEIIVEPVATPEVVVPAPEPVILEPVIVPDPIPIPDPVPEIVAPVVENIPIVESIPIPSSNVSST